MSENNFLKFTVIYNKHKTKVFNYVVKMTADRFLAEDIVQNVFLKFYENLNTINNQQDFNYWLIRVARNEVYDYFRKNKNIIRVPDLDDSSISDSDTHDSVRLLEMREFSELLSGELSKLPQEQKEVFILKEYAGLSYREISVLLNIEENLVKSRLYKTRQKLIERLKAVI